MGAVRGVVVGKHPCTDVPEDGLFRGCLWRAWPWGSRRLGKDGAYFANGIQDFSFAKEFDRVRFQYGIALPETRVAGIDSATSFGIALHVVRGDVGGRLRELHGISIGRKIRGAHTALRADVAGRAGELNPSSAGFGGRVSSDGVPGQNRGLRGAKECRMIRLCISLSFL